jgi:hypothetical protein
MGPFSSLLSTRLAGDLIRSRANGNELQVHYSSQVLDKRAYETRGYLDRRQQARRQRGGMAVNESRLDPTRNKERFTFTIEKVDSGENGERGTWLVLMRMRAPDFVAIEAGVGRRAYYWLAMRPMTLRIVVVLISEATAGARLTVRTVCNRALRVRIRRWSRSL